MAWKRTGHSLAARDKRFCDARTPAGRTVRWPILETPGQNSEEALIRARMTWVHRRPKLGLGPPYRAGCIGQLRSSGESRAKFNDFHVRSSKPCLICGSPHRMDAAWRRSVMQGSSRFRGAPPNPEIRRRAKSTFTLLLRCKDVTVCTSRHMVTGCRAEHGTIDGRVRRRSGTVNHWPIPVSFRGTSTRRCRCTVALCGCVPQAQGDSHGRPTARVIQERGLQIGASHGNIL